MHAAYWRTGRNEQAARWNVGAPAWPVHCNRDDQVLGGIDDRMRARPARQPMRPRKLPAAGAQVKRKKTSRIVRVVQVHGGCRTWIDFQHVRRAASIQDEIETI